MGRTSSIYCLHCHERLDDGRKSYHDACIPLARAAAQIEPRVCPKCGELREAAQYVNDSTRITGKFPYCTPCTNGKAKAQSDDAPLNGYICPLDDVPVRGHKNRRYCSMYCKDRCTAIRRYGLTVAQYRQMVDATGGFCPVCGDPCSDWFIDHNHKTGKVTGVVCNTCNTGPLMTSRHDVELVKRLLSFLELTPAERLGVDATVSRQVQSTIDDMWRRQR